MVKWIASEKFGQTVTHPKCWLKGGSFCEKRDHQTSCIAMGISKLVSSSRPQESPEDPKIPSFENDTHLEMDNHG